MLKITHPTVVKMIRTGRSIIKTIAFPFGIVQNIISTLTSSLFKGVKKGIETFIQEDPEHRKVVDVKGIGNVETSTIIEHAEIASTVIETVEVAYDTYSIFVNLGTITGFMCKYVPIALPTVFPPYLPMIGIAVGVVLATSYFLCS